MPLLFSILFFFNGGLTMNYAINNSCLFNPEDRLLSSPDNSVDPIVLSKYASKALLTLVISSQEVVPRERLFSVIWADDRSFASNASLNNYISEIRKALQHFDEDDIIETIPRLGFKFRGVVKNIPRNTKEPEIKGADNETHHQKKIPRARIIRAITVIMVPFVIAALFFSNNNSTLDSDYLFTIDKCDIYLLTWSNDEKESQQYINSAINKQGINCKSSPRDIFFSEGNRYNHAYKTQIITVCDKENDDQYAECVNLKKASSNDENE